MSEFLTVHEVCIMSGICVDTLRRWVRAGKFPKPSHRKGARKFWTREEVETAVLNLTERID